MNTPPRSATVILLLVCCSLMLLSAGCGTTQKTSTSDHSGESVPAWNYPTFLDLSFEEPISPQVEARALLDAEKAIEAGRLTLISYGRPGPTWFFRTYVLKTRYDINVHHRGCLIVDGIDDVYLNVHNIKMKAAIKRKFGEDVFEKIDAATDREYQRFKEHTGGDVRNIVAYRQNMQKLMDEQAP